MQLSTNLRLRRKFLQENPHGRRCNVPGCNRAFKNSSGLTKHQNVHHPGYIPQPEAADLSTSTHLTPPLYTSEEEVADEDQWDHQTPENSDASGQNESTDRQSHGGGSCHQHSTPSNNEDETRGVDQGDWAGPSESGSRRATVEDVDDDDDYSSASSRNVHSKTSKSYHPILNGVSSVPFINFND